MNDTPEQAPMKVCSKCGEEKPLFAFGKRKSATGAVDPRCKECTAAYQKEYYLQHKEKKAVQSRKYREDPAFRERERERERARREANPDLYRDKGRKHRAPDRWARAGKKWCKPNVRKCPACQQIKSLSEFHLNARDWLGRNRRCKQCATSNTKKHYDRPETRQRLTEYRKDPIVKQRALEAARRYLERHPDRKPHPKKWSELSPDKYEHKKSWYRAWRKRRYQEPEFRARSLTYSQRRRAKKQSLAQQLTAEEWLWLLEQTGRRCVYCGRHESETGTLAQEHVIPLSKGGAYTVTNIVPSCNRCNSIKGARTPTEAGMVFVIEINPLKHMEQKPLL